MFNFFTWFVDCIKLCWDCVLNIFESLFNLFSVLLTSMQSVSLMITFLPPIITSSVVLVLSVTVLNYIVGRSNQ